MAERRMFAKTIIDSDAFLDMSLTTQALYFHLSMRADDDGFINNPRKIQRMIGAADDDLKILIAKNFIIPFESGIVVIKHWKIHNYIRGDRKKDTVYPEEMSRLTEKENGAYSLLPDACLSTDRQLPVNCQPTAGQMVYQMDTQVRVGKDSLGKSSTGEDNMPDSDEPAPPPAPKKTKPTRHKDGEYKNVLLSDEEMDKLKDEFPSDWPDRIERLSAYMASHGKVYKNHLATIRNWAKKDAEARPNIQHGATGKTTKAEELEDFYRMADEFGRGL